MKKVHIKSAMPIYIAAAVWLLAGLIFPKALLKLPTLLIVAVVSAAAGLVSRKFFPGCDIEVEEKIQTGDNTIDKAIAEGRARLKKLREANEAIPNPQISANLDRITNAGDQIFKELARDTGKITLVRRFMNYYLPTTEKIMDQYQIMMTTSARGENIQTAMTRIEGSLGMIADAFEKCVDDLFADREMDIDAEIQVMKTMLSSDGLINAETNDIRTHAKAESEKNQSQSAAGN